MTRSKLLIILLIILIKPLYSQIDLGIPTITGKSGAFTILKDYECIGVNPSNLGWNNNNRLSFSGAYISFTAQSKALNLPQLFNAVINPNKQFSEGDKYKYAQIFNNDEGLNLSIVSSWVDLSVSLGKFGGLAFNIRDRINFHIGCNEQFSDILFKGVKSELYNDPNIYNYKVSEVFSGSNLKLMHLRDFNIAYGLKVLTIKSLELYAGVGYRYIWGLGFIDIYADKDYLYARNSFHYSNYSINNGVVRDFKLSKFGNVFNSGGKGNAIDLGANAILLKHFKFGVSVLDLGSITWDKKTLKGINVNMKKLDSLKTGIKSFNLFDEASYLFDSSGLLEFTDIPSFTTKLPSRFRAGAGIRVGKRLELCADIVTPLNEINGYKDKSFISLGVMLDLLGIFKINAAYVTNKQIGNNVPVGLTFSTKGFYEIYLATNDVLTFINQTKNPMLSFAFCSVRLNIPRKNK